MPENCYFFDSPCKLAEDTQSLYSKVKVQETVQRHMMCSYRRYEYTTYLQVHAEFATPPLLLPKTHRICANLTTHSDRGRVGTCPPVPTRDYASAIS